MLGANVVTANVGPLERFIVLVPDMLDVDALAKDVFPMLLTRKVIPSDSCFEVDCKKPTYRGSRVKFLYYSWLFDTICANIVAPIRPYCLGFLG